MKLSNRTRALLGVLLVSGAGLSATPAPPPGRTMSLRVDLSERKMELYIDGQLTDTYPVAVGQPEFATPVGNYGLDRVVWNPSWIPPDAEWAEDKEPKAPGEVGNPMGRVKIYFSPAYYIHGTMDTASLGRPASHGCIRMRNQDAVNLARWIQDLGGAAETDTWYDDTLRAFTRTREVSIPNPPTLTVSP